MQLVLPKRLWEEGERSGAMTFSEHYLCWACLKSNGFCKSMLLNPRGHGMNTPFPRPSIRSSSIQFSMADVHGCFDNERAVSGGELGCGNCEADFNADSVRNSNSA